MLHLKSGPEAREKPMRVDGACLCGHVTFEAEVEPDEVVLCNCTDCQTQSGVFRAIVVAKPGSFVLGSGSVKAWPKVAESGRNRTLAFCPECGTSIYGGPGEGEEGPLSVRVGAIRQRAQLRPVAQVWCGSALPWWEQIADLPRLDAQPGVEK